MRTFYPGGYETNIFKALDMEFYGISEDYTLEDLILDESKPSL